MHVEPYRREKHFLTLADWWKYSDARDLDPEPSLSPFGAVAMDKQGIVMAGWLYLCIGVKVAFIERFVGRPGLPLLTARDAGELLLAHFITEARASDYTQLFVHACRPGMVRSLEKLGFAELEPEAKLMSRRI